MCQIIALQSKKSNIIKYLIENQNKIKLSLDRKGGEGYSISAFIDKAEKYKRKKIPKFIITKSKDFNGIFAFAYLDKLNNKLILARDRFGVKPLYYYFENNKLLFSSEIKVIKKIINLGKIFGWSMPEIFAPI